MSSASEIDSLFIQKNRRDTRLRDLQKLARKHGIRCEEVPRTTLNELISDLQHQGVVARLRKNSGGLREDLLDYLVQRQAQTGCVDLLILILDEVQDPHNLGACLRSADAAGVDAVVMPADNSVGLTPVVRKVASGAAESVALFQVVNLQRTITDLQAMGIWVYGAAGEAADNLYSLDLRGSVALVMGGESKGLRQLTRQRCDALFSLPMAGRVSSLNVSVAAGVSLFEVVRQRL